MYGVIFDYLFLKVKSLNASVLDSGDEVDEPNTQYKKLRASSPDVNDSGQENKTETIKIETVSENTETGYFSKKSNEDGRSIQNFTCKNNSDSAEFENQSLFIDKEDLDIPENPEKEQIVLNNRYIEQNN